MLIALACIALSAVAILLIFHVKPDPSDFQPHRTKLDQLM